MRLEVGRLGELVGIDLDHDHGIVRGAGRIVSTRPRRAGP